MMRGSASPRISCIIPTHDRADLLREALLSVLAQDLPDGTALEVLVVDDMGTAETRRVVQDLPTTRGRSVRVLHRKTGARGASSSRNEGARVAEGDILAFLDDDDLWRPDHLRHLVDVLDRTRTDMVVSWTDEFDETGTVRPLKRMLPGLTARSVAVDNPGFRGSNFAITRAAFARTGGFDPELPVSNDKDFLVRFLLAGLSYEVAPITTVLYRQHSGPQLTKNTRSRAAGIELYIAKHADLLSPRDVSVLRRTINVIKYRTAPDLPSRAAALAAVAGHTLRSRVGGRRAAVDEAAVALPRAQ